MQAVAKGTVAFPSEGSQDVLSKLLCSDAQQMLAVAIEAQVYPSTREQRCTVHKTASGASFHRFTDRTKHLRVQSVQL